MSLSRCPYCQSTDITSVTCNNCGAMLLFEGDEGKVSSKDASTVKKQQSTEDIIREIMEASRVKTYPFEKIEYIDKEEEIKDSPKEKEAESLEQGHASLADPNKSFVDIARDMGYKYDAEPSEEVTEDKEAIISEQDPEKNETALFDDTKVVPVIEDASSDTEDAPETVYDEVEVSKEEITSEWMNTEDSEAVAMPEADADKDNSSHEDTIVIRDCSNDEDAEASAAFGDGSLEETRENTSLDDTPDNDDEQKEKESLVKRISQAVSEKIRKEESEDDKVSDDDDDEVDLFSPPEWTNSEKTIVKEPHKKKEKPEEKVPCGSMEIDTGFNKALNVCRALLILLMAVTVVCMFLPWTRIGGFSSTQDVQIFAIISVVPFLIGFVLSIREKNYIRKYIYSLLASGLFITVYFVFMIAISGSNAKDYVYPILCAAIIAVSVVGICVDRSPAIKKANTWFDAFAYILLFVNLFVILFIALFVIIVPDMVGGPEISLYLYEMCAVMTLGVISSILILKRVMFGADLLLVSAIALIIVNIISYNKIMSAISFDYTVNIPYMHYMGIIFAAINVICTAVPMGMFFWMKHLKRVTPKETVNEE